jgi:hypothetical protein
VLILGISSTLGDGGCGLSAERFAHAVTSISLRTQIRQDRSVSAKGMQNGISKRRCKAVTGGRGARPDLSGRRFPEAFNPYEDQKVRVRGSCVLHRSRRRRRVLTTAAKIRAIELPVHILKPVL